MPRSAGGERAPVQLASIVRDMVAIIRETFPKNIVTRTDLPAALWLVAAMNVAFLAALGQAAWRELDIVCGCFGRPAAVRGAGYFGYLARGIALLAAALWLLRRGRSPSPSVAAEKP